MAGKRKEGVDYFPHFVSFSKTKFIFEERWGNDGYAFLYKLFEMLGETKDHYIDTENAYTKQFMLSKMRISETVFNDMIHLLAEMGKIDPFLSQVGIIWYQNLVDNVEDVYKKRKIDPPNKEKLYELYADRFHKKGITVTEISVVEELPSQEPEQTEVIATEMPQSKVKEIKVKEIKGKDNDLTSVCASAHTNTPAKNSKFRPPTIEQAQEYISEKGYTNVDAEKWHSYYEANGWKVGRNTMKNWRASIAYWNRTQLGSNYSNGTYKTKQELEREKGKQAVIDIIDEIRNGGGDNVL